MTAHAASTVYFGLNPMWVSTCILAITYGVIMTEKVNRAIRHALEDLTLADMSLAPAPLGMMPPVEAADAVS